MEDIQGWRQRSWDEDRKTSQFGLLIDPKSDSSVFKVVQQLPCRMEALQWSKLIPKQPLKKVDAKVVNRHPPMGKEDEN
jgi:hypothetical protein